MSEPVRAGDAIIKTVEQLLASFKTEGSYPFVAHNAAEETLWVECKPGYSPVQDAVTRPGVAYWTLPVRYASVCGDPLDDVIGVALLPDDNVIETIAGNGKLERFENVNLVVAAPITF